MQYLSFSAAGVNGAALPYAKANVYLTGTTTLATIYDQNGVSLPNPAVATQTGLTGFAAANGVYDVQITSSDSTYSAPLWSKLQIVDVAALASQVSAIGAAGITVGAVTYATLALLNADLAHAAGTLGWVYGDSTTTNNGLYAKTGASGSGGWTFTGIAITTPVALANLGSDVLAYINGGTASQGVTPATDGSFTVSLSGSTVIPILAFSQSGYLNTVAIYAAISGVATLVTVSVSGSTATIQSSMLVQLSAGSNLITTFNPQVQAGQYIGVYSAGASQVRYANSGPGFYYCGGLPTVGGSSLATSAGYTTRIGWTITNGVAGETARAQGAEAILQGLSASGGVNSPVAGTAGASAGYSRLGNSPIGSTGTLNAVSFYASASGTVYLLVASLSGSTLTLQAISNPISATTGVNTVTGFNPAVQNGWYVGIYSASSTIPDYVSATGVTLNYCGGLIGGGVIGGTASLLTTSNLQLEMGWTVTGGLIGEALRAQGVEGLLQSQITGTAVSQGSATALTYNISAGFTVFSSAAASQSGQLTSVSVYSGASGPGYIVVTSKSGSNASLFSSTPVTLVSGLNAFACGIAISAGQFVGIYATNLNASYQTSSGPGFFYCTGVPGASTPITTSSGTVGLAWTIASGVLTRLSAVETVAASNLNSLGSFAAEGVGLFVGADLTGVADATAIVAAARAQHTAPHVPAGLLSVTAIPYGLEGFWGEGKIMKGGVYYPIPKRPSDGALLNKVRSSMAALASSGSPKVLIGDSLSAHFYASTLANHWWNKLSYWLNADYAPGSEPSTCLLQDDSPDTAAFYGITTSGSIGFGTNGPVARSTILASGASITFTGNYNQVDVFYTQQSGAGTLAFAFNGATFKTLSCAGSTVLDVFSGPTVTGHTGASGPYTITASGGSVELTGLVRLGQPIATAGTPGPILTMRQAHGGYTTVSFGTAQVNSIIAQAQNLSGLGSAATPEYTVSLLTNDALFGNSPRPSTFQTNLTRIMNALTASGASRVEVVTPTRPLYASWGTNYASGQSFDTFIGIAAAVCKSLGIPLLRLDEIDMVGEGILYSDNLHWNNTSNQVVFDTYARWRADS
jgi:hypothetical protein